MSKRARSAGRRAARAARGCSGLACRGAHGRL